VGVWSIRGAAWHCDRLAVEPLQAGREHRTVDLVQQPPGDVHHARRVDAEQVPVIRQVVDGAQRDAIDHGGDPFRTRVLDDVSGLDERGLLQRADRRSVRGRREER